MSLKIMDLKFGNYCTVPCIILTHNVLFSYSICIGFVRNNLAGAFSGHLCLLTLKQFKKQTKIKFNKDKTGNILAWWNVLWMGSDKPYENDETVCSILYFLVPSVHFTVLILLTNWCLWRLIWTFLWVNMNESFSLHKSMTDGVF